MEQVSFSKNFVLSLYKKKCFVLSTGWQRVLSSDKRGSSGAVSLSNQINGRTEVQNNYEKRKGFGARLNIFMFAFGFVTFKRSVQASNLCQFETTTNPLDSTHG